MTEVSGLMALMCLTVVIELICTINDTALIWAIGMIEVIGPLCMSEHVGHIGMDDMIEVSLMIVVRDVIELMDMIELIRGVL